MNPNTTNDRLVHMAERFKRYFTNQGLAETSFVASAKFRGFPSDLINAVATKFWPDGPRRRFATPESLDLDG